MGSLPRNLSVHAPWTGVMSALGLRVADESALPCRTRCPLCSGTRLTIYEDTISGGAWHYCFDCRSVGDMIELAAKVWKTSPAAVFVKLIDRGLPIPNPTTPEDINAYVVGYQQRRNRVAQFARDAGEHLLTKPSPALNRLCDQFRIKGNMSAERWRDGPGRMVGGYPHIEVERVFSPGSIDRNRCFSRSRIFRGRGWTDVITVPYFDLPERICGFLFVGRGGDKEDFTYKVVVNRPLFEMVATGEQEGGLSCLWAGNEPNTRIGRFAVAVADPMLALRLQVRHYASARRPLPLVAFRDGHLSRTRAAWRALDKTPVIWGWRLTAAMVNQAIASDGRMYLTELRDASKAKIDHYVRDNEPYQIVRRVIEKALPWREFLVEWAADKDDGVVEALFAALDGYGLDRNLYSHICPRLSGLAERHDPTRKVRLTATKEVVERAGEWFLRVKKVELRMLNAIVRVDGTRLVETAKNPGHETLVYYGRVLTADKECPFEATGKALRDPATLQTAVTRAGSTCSLICPNWYGYKLLEVALLFRAAGVT